MQKACQPIAADRGCDFAGLVAGPLRAAAPFWGLRDGRLPGIGALPLVGEEPEET